MGKKSVINSEIQSAKDSKYIFITLYQPRRTVDAQNKKIFNLNFNLSNVETILKSE